jgi:hypothetical protein
LKKLYLHIGSHKTGTTSIQKALFENPSLLKDYNLYYFSKNPNLTENPKHNCNRWFTKINPDDYSIGCTLYDMISFSDHISKFPGNVIVSAERFSFIFLEEELIKLKKCLRKYFDEIKIIVYIRRQDQYIVSHHNQAAKQPLAPATHFYGSELSAIPIHKDYFKYYLDYNERLSYYASVFGKENIIIRIFDKNNLHNHDVVSDFFNVLGIVNFKNSINTNESYCFEKVKIGLLMNQVGLPLGVLRSIIERNLNTDLKFLPCENDAKKFYDIYRKSNIALNKKFNIVNSESPFDDDFSMYPFKGNELWTEEVCNEAIRNILKSLNETYGSINYNVLFQAAIKLENIDFKLSYEIIRILSNILPEDKIVKNKLHEYIESIKSKQE